MKLLEDVDKIKNEEQGRISCGTNMSMSQVDPKSQTHMASHATPEMKMQGHKDDYKEGSSYAKKWMINQAEVKECEMKRMIENLNRK